jgi:copper chaperone NosL
MMAAMLRAVRRAVAGALLLPLALLACGGVEPAEVHLGVEECAHCSMMISDRRFATQVLNTNGRSWKFDSIECLRAFMQAGTLHRDELHSAWVTDANDEGWVRAEAAVYLQSDAVRSPMGGGLLAFAAAPAAHAAREDAGGGSVMSWPEVLAATPATGSSMGSH